MNEKFIIYGAGNCGYKSLMKYGEENVLCFVDNYKNGMYYGKEIISLEKLKELYEPNQHKVIIAVECPNTAWEIKYELESLNIPMEAWEGTGPLLHVHVCAGRVNYDYEINRPFAWRATGTVRMLDDMLANYSHFGNHDFDFFVYYMDDVFEAARICDLLKRKYIFAYSEVYGINNVISIPDYKFILDFAYGKSYYTDIIKSFQREKEWTDKRAFWTGNMDTDKTRRILVELGKEYEDKLYVNWFMVRDGKVKYGELINTDEWMRYKYFIDLRGCGWTERVKYLLAMKRPLFLVDRPYREYYYNSLKPMVHYVPVKEDLSDLMEKIQILENTPGLYDEIVNNAFEFCKNNFSKDRIRKELYNRICKYGVSVNN